MLLGLGGTFLFVPSFQLANAFPKHSGLVVAIITGAFDASSSVFLSYRMAYEASDVSIMPSHAYHTTAQLAAKIEKASDQTRDIHVSDGDISDSNELIRVRSARSDRRKAKLDKLEEIAGDSEYREARIRAEEERQETSGVWGVLHGMSAHRQILTPWYILILLLTVLQMLRMNYFIATIGSQYRYMLGSEEASAINHFFDAALPMGGVLSTPLIGLVLNNLSVPTTFGLLTSFTVAIGVFNCVPSIWAGYMTVLPLSSSGRCITRPSRNNALHAASSEGHQEIIRLLLSKGADVNAQGEYYSNALFAASSGGHQEIVGLLLNTGADVNAHGGYYGNALQAASSGGHQEIAALLQKNGAITSSKRPGSRAPSNPVKKPRLSGP
ncbi:unnamed protein product [Clonostachys rosea f. rosea IK726]|uniref:Uncharacterized protein n=1 Tax=Clonostachys rosea f. rosea IK726 TaxID=1349383 RepID=A0ACA9U9N1_BIOOC|nr:unnamed protein product [Clonostachys rosea f. rosea IK726]